MSIDLKNLSIDPDGQKETYQLIDPRTEAPLTDEDGNTAILTVWGPDSKVYKAFNRKIISQRMSKKAKKGEFTIDEADVEEGEKTRIDRCVAIVDSWENIGFDGEELECTDENKRMVFSTAPWIVEQVERFAADRANFMKG